MPAPSQKGPFLFCPRTGRFIGFKSTRWWLWWLFPVVGFFALLWFLVRVVPKPSRAAYPCQKVAAPVAWGFLGYVVGLPLTVMAFRKARLNLWRSRYMLAAICLVAAGVGAVVTLQGCRITALEMDQSGQALVACLMDRPPVNCPWRSGVARLNGDGTLDASFCASDS